MIHSGADDQAVALAAQCLRDGGLIGLPTETVYGLGADANNPAAVAQVFALKGRPSDHPLIVHVLSIDQVAVFAAEVPEFARRLMAAFWPGPLTLILPRQPGVAAPAAGGQATVGLRCPSHPVAQAVLKHALALGVTGLAGPSANHLAVSAPPPPPMWCRSWGTICWCSMAALVLWALSPPSSTAAGACRCCCAPACCHSMP
jgi:L-threonylcarbamoyladenylate synthase